MKHIDSISQAIKKNPSNPESISEPVIDRIMDAQNYLGLLVCLLIEDFPAYKKMLDLIKEAGKEAIPKPRQDEYRKMYGLDREEFESPLFPSFEQDHDSI